jgi:hypothetical protein
MTPARKLSEVLNVRLDQPLAREIGRIAGTQGRSESEVARDLLRYGIEVQRRLEAGHLAKPFSWTRERDEDDEPGKLIIEARIER